MVRLKDGREVDLELFKFDACWYCQRVFRKLEDLGVAGRVRLRDTWREPKANAELIRRGGKRQVPCLFVDGEPMYESVDINAWLDRHVVAPGG
jgi:glutaredoxin